MPLHSAWQQTKGNYMENQNHLLVNETFEEFKKTERYESVKKTNPKWLKKTEKRLQNDKPNRNRIIGEMRAYATLLSLPGYRVRPISPTSEPRPDFALENITTHFQINVETFTVDYKPNCTINESGGSSNGFKETIVTPLVNQQKLLEKVKPEEVSITKATIDALGWIKDEEHQATEGCNILYIDLEGPWSIWAEQAYPLMEFNGSLTSGAYWMAFYGEEGMPIFEKLDLNEPVSRCTTMGHPGRFMKENPSRFDAVLLMHCPKGGGLVFFENPKSKFASQLEDLKITLLKSGLLNLDASCLGFGSFNLMDFIRLRNQWLKEFAKRVLS